MNGKKRLLWADALKIAAIFGVILIHSAAPLLIRYDTLGISLWWVGNLYDSLARWSIPIFIMLSGAFLLPEYSESTLPRFFFRRFRRVFVPFTLWSMLYFLWRIYVNDERLAPADFFPLFLREPVYYHLWFFYLVMALYLLAPLLSVFAKNAGRSNITWFLILWLLFGSVFPLFDSILSFTIPFLSPARESVVNYVGFFVLGYLLREVRITGAKGVLLAALFLCAFAATAYGTYYLTVVRSQGVFRDVLYDYYSINVVVMAVTVYLIAKSIAVPSFFTRLEARSGVVRTITLCVPGMYLVHPMVIAVLKRKMLWIHLNEMIVHPAIGIPLFALVVGIVSLIIVLLLRQMPGIRLAVP